MNFIISIHKQSLYFILVYFFLFIQASYAFEQFSFDVEQIVSNAWVIKKAKLSLLGLQNKKQQLRISIKQLELPEPFSKLQIVDVRCQSFTWQQKNIDCRRGKARLKSNLIDSSPFIFSFSIAEKHSQLTLKNLPVAKGTLSIVAKENNGIWLVSIKSQNIKLKQFAAFLKNQQPTIDEITNGSINAEINLTGTKNGFDSLLIKSMFTQLSFQADEGRIATESLDFSFDLKAKKINQQWQWEHKNVITQGETYKAPFYIAIDKEKEINLTSKGTWKNKQPVVIHQANMTLSDIADIKAEGTLKLEPALGIESANIQTNIKDLNYLSTHYLSSIFEQTALEGISFKGQVESEFKLSGSSIKQASSKFTGFTVNDLKQRIELNKSQGEINWSANPNFDVPSTIQWESIKIRAIPFGKGQLNLLLKHKNISLLKKSTIPLLDGVFAINQFNWQHNIDNDPTVYFEGGIKKISLDRLSQVLDWTPLTGHISGYIPGVEYKNKILKLNGELKVNVFDGSVRVNKLASSGLFTDYPTLSMDMEIDRLDLHAITQKLEMGGIEGRISGFVNNLHLENWKPVTFYAWLGTPENDDSRHRISQKAVENIASIGGGGAADVISKGFLRFFDTFGYSRLGFGCYLHQGVCQLMGVEAAEQGYYIIKGGGLPRIDVIGYNPQVDWQVLMQRLSRIADTDNIVIE